MTAHIQFAVEPPNPIRDLVNEYVQRAVELCMEEASDFAVEWIEQEYLSEDY